MKESFGNGNKPKALLEQQEEYLKGSPEEIRDEIFNGYMRQQLLEDFFSELEGYVSSDEAEVMRGVLDELADDEMYAVLSLPHELRERKFTEFQKKIEDGVNPKILFKRLVDISLKLGFGIGFHTSPYDIKPDSITGRWSIKGTEKDHRDGDRAMAYYSKKYRHLFKKKNPQFIYIVRTEPETHKTDGNWSRASELSVVGRVPFEKVFSYVERESKELEKKKGTP